MFVMDPYSNSKSYSVLTVVSSKGREEENNWAPAPRLRVLMLPSPPPAGPEHATAHPSTPTPPRPPRPRPAGAAVDGSCRVVSQVRAVALARRRLHGAPQPRQQGGAAGRVEYELWRQRVAW